MVFPEIIQDRGAAAPHDPLPRTPMLAEVYRIRISGLKSGRIQLILNKPEWTRTTVLFKFPDQDFQISFFGI